MAALSGRLEAGLPAMNWAANTAQFGSPTASKANRARLASMFSGSARACQD
jgi:hypothetical protein